MVAGTASRVDRWVLVEAAGPWGQRALPPSRDLPDDLILQVQQRAKAAHARLLLIRKPGRPVRRRGREVYAADSRDGYQLLRRRVVRADEELIDLRLPFDGVEAEGWEPAPAVVGVCTHGRHDTCCAVFGRPVAAALADSHRAIAYEISHIGGDRFAANILVLPGGHYLGQVPPALAGAVVDQVLTGRRPAAYYRGRSVWPMQVQAAQHFAAERLGIDSLSELRPTAVRLLERHRWRVTLAADAAGREVFVEVAQQQGPESVRLTCHAEHEHAVPSWRLLELRSG